MFNPFVKKFEILNKESGKEDFLDLDFKIVKTEIEEGFVKVSAAGYWHDKKIEISVGKIPAHTNPTFVSFTEGETKIARDVYKGTVDIAYTSELTECLSFYSEETPKSFKGQQIISADILPLSDKNYDLSSGKGYFRYKIFIQSEENKPFIQDEENYAECFLNVDLDKMILGLHEKDISYRKSLQRLLMK